LLGTPKSAGEVVSTTLICCWQDAVLTQLSVAVQVRKIVDAWGHEPGVVASALVTFGVDMQLSVADANPVFVGSDDASHWIVLATGHIIVGGIVSRMVTTAESLKLERP
jgi:hypothetical protein